MSDLEPLKSKDGRFTYESAGDPTYPPLMFLHGIGGAARSWRGQLNFFRDCYSTIAWDMPGYGGSAPLTVVNIGSLAAALHDFLQQVGAKKPILVGHSIGGMIVQQLLAKSPNIAAALVLAQTSPAFGRPDGDWQKSFQPSIRGTVHACGDGSSDRSRVALGSGRVFTGASNFGYARPSAQ